MRAMNLKWRPARRQRVVNEIREVAAELRRRAAEINAELPQDVGAVECPACGSSLVLARRRLPEHADHEGHDCPCSGLTLAETDKLLYGNITEPRDQEAR